MPVRWGILSTARINDSFLGGLAQTASGEALAVASREPARAAEYARAHDIARAHGSYEALLADPDVDAVYISLPNGLHIEWTRRALEAGKHVLCEKPLSRRADEVQETFALAERSGRVLMEAFMYRHHPQTRRVAELVGAGAVGRLRLIRATFSFPLSDDADVRLQTGLDGGALMDVGCYCVSAARLLAGEPRAAYGAAELSAGGVDEVFAGTLQFAHGVLAQFDAGFALASRGELEVVGEEASLFVADPWHCRAPGVELRRADGTERITVAPADSYRLQADNMAAAIAGTAAPLVSRAESVGQARTIEALYASAESGRPVECSP